MGYWILFLREGSVLGALNDGAGLHRIGISETETNFRRITVDLRFGSLQGLCCNHDYCTGQVMR